ncbi:MAG: ubiquitin-like small modifier protein 1 [Longimicrobiaceae bacterium]
MGITIALPGALQPYAGGSPEVELADRFRTVGDALAALAERHGGVMDRVTDERGELRPHVNVFVDGENVRFLDGLGTALGEESTIVIVPAVSGG